MRTCLYRRPANQLPTKPSVACAAAPKAMETLYSRLRSTLLCACMNPSCASSLSPPLLPYAFAVALHKRAMSNNLQSQEESFTKIIKTHHPPYLTFINSYFNIWLNFILSTLMTQTQLFSTSVSLWHRMRTYEKRTRSEGETYDIRRRWTVNRQAIKDFRPLDSAKVRYAFLHCFALRLANRERWCEEYAKKVYAILLPTTRT